MTTRCGSSTMLAGQAAVGLNSDLRSQLFAHARRFQTSLAAACALGVFACSGSALADIVNVTPNVADDIGNWTTTTVLDLEIRLNGFTGYTATGVAADTIVDDKYRSGKVSHPQHVVRLPNTLGPDGQWHAYFAITHSGDCDPLVENPITTDCTFDDMLGGDGYWMVAEIDADAYDHTSDRIINSPDSDGRYVFEEHFKSDNPRGDWNHPAAMAVMGDALLMVGQQFDPEALSYPGIRLYMGDSPDALLFYDVSQPRAPVYVGKLDVCQLGLASVCGGGSGRDVLSGLGLAHFENGWYHLSVGGAEGVVGNFYCDSGADCFKAPITIGPSGNWKDLPPSGAELQAGGQQGSVIHSREIYSEAPGPGEACYKQDGTLLQPGELDAHCTPAGVRRALYSFADHNAGKRYVQASCWPYTTSCNLLTYNEDPKYTKPFDFIPGFESLGALANFLGVRNSADLDVFRRDAGIPFFDEIVYQSSTGTVLSPGADSAVFVGRSRVRNKAYFSQLSGECQSGNGTHVDTNGEVLIYCVTERTTEFNGVLDSEQPHTCPENSLPAPVGESCNLLYENRPNGALSYGVIKITEPGGKQITYRGRGLADVEQLNQPPWGPGRNQDGSLKDPNAVDWKLALGTPGTEIRVLSGNWVYYAAENFVGPDSYFVDPDPAFYVINPGAVPPMRSLRAMPEHGVALFEFSSYRGRMVSASRSVPDLVRYCGGDETLCLALSAQNCTDPGATNPLWYKNCRYPRTFSEKTSSVRVKHSSWDLYRDANFGGGSAELFAPGFFRWASDPNRQLGGSFREAGGGSCKKPLKPLGALEPEFPYGFIEPLLSWDPVPVPGGDRFGWPLAYEIVIERLNGAIVFSEILGAPQPIEFGTGNIAPFKAIWPSAPGPTLEVGQTYRWRFRAIDSQHNCYEEGPWSDYQSLTVAAPSFEVSLSGVTSDPLGLGTGSIDFSPDSDKPVSELGGNYFEEGSVIILVAIAAPDSEFVSWAGDAASCGTATQCQLPVTANLNVQAEFRPKPRLYRSPQGEGTVTVNPTGVDCTNTGWACDAYALGTQVTMTAAAVPGESQFLRWAGDADCMDDDDNDGNPLTSRVTLSEKRACTAVFERSNYLLEVTTATGGGTVSGTDDIPGVLACDPQGQICSKTYTANIERTATLTATPADASFRFVRWYGSNECWSDANGEGKNNPINVTVGTADVSCRAVFVDVNGVYTLNVEKTGAGARASTVTAVVTAPTPAELPQIDCALPGCTTEVPSTATIQLTATPVRGARFDGWFGSSPLCELPPIQVPDPDNLPFTMDSPDPNPVITVDMTEVAALGGDLSCRANFSANILLVDGSADGSSTGPRVDYGQVFNTLPDINVDVWSVKSPGSSGTVNPVRTEPTADDLARYSRVVWFTADASTANPFPLAAGPSPEAETALAQYLDGGGCLLLSSPEYFNNRGLTSFAQSYFGVSAASQNIGAATAVRGAGLLPGFNGLGRSTLDYGTATGANLNAALSDAVVANSDPATYALLRYDNGSLAGVGRDNGVYRTAFLGFPFLALPSGIARSEVMGTFLDYCLQLEKDDDFETNDDGVSDAIRSDIDDQLATRLQGNVNLTDLKILPGNEDWYRWEASAKADTRFEILFSHDSGNLNFDLYEGNRRDPIASMQSTDDNELQDFFTVPETSTGGTNYYFLRVYGVAGASNDYTLRITSTFVDADNDGISVYMDTDDDGDGMSDEFEINNGFDPLLAADAFLDADGDGFSNFDEFIAGTGPRDSGSVPAPPSNLSPLNFVAERCQPGTPRVLCGPISLPWLGILLGD